MRYECSPRLVTWPQHFAVKLKPTKAGHVIHSLGTYFIPSHIQWLCTLALSDFIFLEMPLTWTPPKTNRRMWWVRQWFVTVQAAPLPSARSRSEGCQYHASLHRIGWQDDLGPWGPSFHSNYVEKMTPRATKIKPFILGPFAAGNCQEFKSFQGEQYLQSKKP